MREKHKRSSRDATSLTHHSIWAHCKQNCLWGFYYCPPQGSPPVTTSHVYFSFGFYSQCHSRHNSHINTGLPPPPPPMLKSHEKIQLQKSEVNAALITLLTAFSWPSNWILILFFLYQCPLFGLLWTFVTLFSIARR